VFFFFFYMKITKRMKDITGQKFNKLTAIKPDHTDVNKLVYWLFKCDCGNEKVISGVRVKAGGAKSCGCLYKGNWEYDANGKRISKAYVPKITTDIETESKINEFRVARHLTWDDLAKKSGIAKGHIRTLMLGVVSPLYEYKYKDKKIGEIKTIALKLMKALDADFADLFPRYACKLERPPLNDIQINYITASNEILNQKKKTINKNIWIYTYKYFTNKIDYKRRFFILRMIYLGYTLDEIGKKINVTRQRIEQIKKQILKTLKNYKYKKALI